MTGARPLKRLVLSVVLTLTLLNFSWFFLVHNDSNKVLVHPKDKSGGNIFDRIRQVDDDEDRGDDEDEENDEADISVAMAPVQQNPWIDSQEAAADIFDQVPFLKEQVGSCSIRQFHNGSVFSRPEFVSEYLGFTKCMGRQVESWVKDKISASVGARSELILKTEFDFKYLPSSCSPDSPPKMVYAVFSSCQNSRIRSKIRQTWARSDRLESQNHKLVFVLGVDDTIDITEEVKEHQDILQTDFFENEDYFGHKQMLSLLAWTYEHCELGRFLVRTTDSTFINTRRCLIIVSHLRVVNWFTFLSRFDLFYEQEVYSANRLYGQLLKKMKPNRNPQRDHFAAKEEWPWDFYPPFLAGPTYVLSGDVVPRLLVAVKYVPFLSLEQVKSSVKCRRESRNLTLPQVFFTGLLPLTNRLMRIGVAEFFVTSPIIEAEYEDEDECVFAKHGAMEGVDSVKKMDLIHQNLEVVQEQRNLTCLIKSTCLAKVNGNCVMYRPKEKKKKRKEVEKTIN